MSSMKVRSHRTRESPKTSPVIVSGLGQRPILYLKAPHALWIVRKACSLKRTASDCGDLPLFKSVWLSGGRA